MATIQPGIEFDSDPFSDHHGKPFCTGCKERVWSAPEQHVCPTMCAVCNKKTYRSSLHRHCCKHPAESLAPWDQLDIRRVSNGQRNYYLRCGGCDSNVPIKNALVPDWAKTATPNSDYTSDKHPCARCDNHLTEYHHFAPRAIFADADFWPGAWLCKACHTLWHGAMREAAGYRLHDRRFCGWADDERRRYPQWPAGLLGGLA